MKRNKRLVYILASFLLSLILIISGCVSDIESGTTTTVTQTTSTQTSTTTTIIGTTTVASQRISITASPSEASARSTFTISWFITGSEAEAQRTSVKYGTESIPSVMTISDYLYSSNVLCTDSPCDIPDPFSIQMSIQDPGKYYFRVHALINGVNIWSEERTITISAPFTPSNREFSIEADDNGFYMNNTLVSSIMVNKGDNTKITFTVRNQSAYYLGLDFRGCGTSSTASSGSSSTINFTASNNCAISSYWPSTGTLKQTLTIRVV